MINVFRVGDQDTNRLADLVQRYIVEEAPKILPEGVKLEMWQDMSSLLKGRMNLLTRNGIAGLLLVFFVLALFLRPSLALLVSIGIPVSFAGAILMMPYNGISINMISLFGFILVLGIVVDDAIIVGENVYQSDPAMVSIRGWLRREGTHEVGVGGDLRHPDNRNGIYPDARPFRSQWKNLAEHSPHRHSDPAVFTCAVEADPSGAPGDAQSARSRRPGPDR